MADVLYGMPAFSEKLDEDYKAGRVTPGGGGGEHTTIQHGSAPGAALPSIAGDRDDALMAFQASSRRERRHRSADCADGHAEEHENQGRPINGIRSTGTTSGITVETGADDD